MCFVKDMKFTYIAGYTVGWHAEGFTKYPSWYEYGDWGWTDDKLFDPYAPVINREYVLKHFPEYKYSAVDKYNGIHLFKYLRLYEQYPQIECRRVSFRSIKASLWSISAYSAANSSVTSISFLVPSANRYVMNAMKPSDIDFR